MRRMNRTNGKLAGCVLQTCAVAVMAAGGTTEARGAVIAEDDFSYPDGDLWGSNGGSGWSSPWGSTAINVTGAEAIGANTVTNPKYGSRNFDNPETTGELFVACDVRTPAAFEVDDYIVVAAQSGVNVQNLVFGKVPGSNEFQVGNGGLTSTGILMEPNTTYRLIGSYDAPENVLSLWVNPDASDYYDPVTAMSSADAWRIELVAFHMSRVVFATNTAVGFAIDNIVVSNTPEGVGLATQAPACGCGDLDGSGLVDLLDFTTLATCFGLSSPSADCAAEAYICADLDGDGAITLNDFSRFSTAFGLAPVGSPPNCL